MEHKVNVLRISAWSLIACLLCSQICLAQTDAWEQALDVINHTALPDRSDYGQVIFTGCGSTYYLSLAAAALYQELTGYAARGVPASELLFNGRTVLTDQRTLLIAVSYFAVPPLAKRLLVGKLGEALEKTIVEMFGRGNDRE